MYSCVLCVTFREEGGQNIDLVRFSDSEGGKSSCPQSLPLIASLLQTARQKGLTQLCETFSGEPPGIRTPDPLIKSQMLCQLS